MKFLQTLIAAVFILYLASCAVAPSEIPAPTQGTTPSPSSAITLSASSTATIPPTPTLPPPEKPLTLVFYGDSILKVGDAGRSGSVGFSIVDALRTKLNSADQIITSNHGGRKAKWGYENLDANTLVYKPDLVTVWWGINDLNGCPGIFDRATNKLVPYELSALINEHIHYMELQIEAILKTNSPVIIITPMPVLGTLPWSHLDPNNELVWENNSRCNFDLGLEQLVEAQRKMVAGYRTGQKPVYLVDAWQIYKDHPNTDNMYMDIIHPGAQGAELIAEEWLQVFQSINR